MSVELSRLLEIKQQANHLISELFNVSSNPSANLNQASLLDLFLAGLSDLYFSFTVD
jgi:hypothetical protein